MNSKVKKILIPILAVILAVGVFFLGFLTRELTYSNAQKAVLNLLDKYEKYYLYEDENVVDVISSAILDKYSTYMTKEEYQSVLNQALGNYEGIGLAFKSKSNKIEGVSLNSSCYKAGVKAGGTLVKIKKDSLEKDITTVDDLTDFLSNVKNGESLTITVDYDNEIVSYNVTKSSYKKSYVSYMDNSGEYAFVEDGDFSLKKISDNKISNNQVAYIKYEQFSGREEGVYGSVTQLKTALDKFKQSSKKSLILDLRDNGGGYMDVLCEVAGLFVEKHSDKQLVSYAKDKNNKIKSFYIENNYYSTYNFEKIIVLANDSTASASEVLIGAMLDYDTQNKVSVVLEKSLENGDVYKTYGKGIMQTTYNNLDGSAVKLTTAQIYWPVSNISIHGEGITKNTSEKVKNSTQSSALDFALSLLN